MNATVFRCPEVRWVSAGLPVEEAAAVLADELGARRLVAFVSGSLLAGSDLRQRLERRLHERLVGVQAGSGTEITDEGVLTSARFIAECRADLVLTVGGGALIDSVKMALIAEAHDVSDAPALWALRAGRTAAGGLRSGLRHPPRLRHVVAPTTLTCAEFSDLTGSSPRPGQPKAYYLAPGTAALGVIHDPEIVRHTPAALWFASGLRALDHAIEGYCSVRPSPLVDAACLAAMGQLKNGLLGVKRDPDDLAARAACQTGAWLAGTAVGRVPFGASHGLGHLLAGIGGVAHGLTSALMLPAVLAHNRPVNGDRQAACARALGADDAAQAVRELVAALGLDDAVRALRVPLPLQQQIASEALSHFVVGSNPRRLESADEVLALLRSAGLPT